MTTTQGIREDVPDEAHALPMGGYGKDEDGFWYCCVPATGFPTGALTKHTVIEHEDGTITVSPSILSYGHHGRTWHGYLERGMWREV